MKYLKQLAVIASIAVTPLSLCSDLEGVVITVAMAHWIASQNTNAQNLVPTNKLPKSALKQSMDNRKKDNRTKCKNRTKRQNNIHIQQARKHN